MKAPLGLLAVGAALLQAQTAPHEAAPPLVLEELIREALTNSPEVTASQKRYEAARLRPSQAASLPETMFSAGWNASGRPWPGAGMGTEPIANAGFMLTQEFPFPGKRKLRGEVSESEAKAEFESYQAAQLSLVSRVKQTWHRLGYTDLAEDVLRRNESLLRRLLRITEIRYASGKAAQQDVFKSQTQLSILETKLVQLQRERAARTAEMLSLLNRRPGAALGHVVMERPKPLARSLEDLFALAKERSPMLRRDEKVIARNQIALNLARKDVYPDYSVTGGYYNMGAMPDMYMVRVDFKLPTSWFRKQRPMVAESAAMLAESRQMLAANAQSLAFRIQDEYLTAQTAEKLMRLYEESIVPQGSLALESSLSSYETGMVDLLSVLMNFQTVLDYQLSYYEEMLSYSLAVARLEELTGARL
ncbi:MAG: TolC family protein [Acidobacteria bacterium]|nr:TolC family protein [Acidobacteriota bacterium]